jgi:hypothetical protein
MIPREILKKIRQIELRTNHLVSGTVGEHACSGRGRTRISQIFSTIIARARNGAKKEMVFWPGVNNPATNLSKGAGSVSPSPWGEGRDEGGCKTNFPLAFASLQPLTQLHRIPKRFRMSALTCSHGIPSWGFFSKSARRRSSSAVCSGVKSGFPHPSSSPYSSNTRSTNARFSSVGIGRICSMSSVALMSSIYPVVGRAQLKISYSSFILHPSALS